MDFDDEIPFELAAQFTRPGVLDLRVLDQTELWVDRNGVVHRIDQMSTTYRLNVLLHLRERAPYFHQRSRRAERIEQLWAAVTEQSPPPTGSDTATPSSGWNTARCTGTC